MVAYYRLSDLKSIEKLGFRLAEGVQVLPPEAFSPVDEATRLVEDARARARDIVRDAEDAREEERRRGFAEGLAQGRLEAVQQALQEARRVDTHLDALEQDIAEIVMASMRKLIDGFDDAARVEAVVRGALKQMRREKKAELRVPPQHYLQLRACLDGILKDFPSFELIEVIEDATLSGASVVVETAVGRVEGDIGSRIGELDTIIHGLLPGGPARTDDAAADLLADAKIAPDVSDNKDDERDDDTKGDGAGPDDVTAPEARADEP